MPRDLGRDVPDLEKNLMQENFGLIFRTLLKVALKIMDLWVDSLVFFFLACSFQGNGLKIIHRENQAPKV